MIFGSRSLSVRLWWVLSGWRLSGCLFNPCTAAVRPIFAAHYLWFLAGCGRCGADVRGKRGVQFDPPEDFAGALDLGLTLFPTYRLLVISLTIILIIALRLFLVRTDLGLVIRAGARDPLMTRALGIRLGRIRLLVFGLGAALAGFAGVLAGPMRQVSPDMGVSTVIEAFVVVVVGGMGSINGAVLRTAAWSSF